MENNMASTKENLNEAFAGESQANQKYRAFAKKAEREGYPNIAKLFATTSEAERIHAEGHLGALDGISSTIENLKASVAGETYEFKEMYPPMYELANSENHKAKRMFQYALKVEEVHSKLYQLAIKAVEQGKDLDVTQIYLCPVCGNIEFGEPPENCPICGTLGSKFIKY
jgi:rubrerythrin